MTKLTNGLANTHITLEKKFESLIRGKSVAILGRGPSLAACDADTVESYDTVVRVHRPAPIDLWWPPPLVQPEWQAKVGKRTDILYTSFGIDTNSPRAVQEEFINRVVTSFLEEGGAIICRPEPIYALHFSVQCASELIEVMTPLRYVTYSMFKELKQAIGATPYPGTCALADVLTYGPSTVFIGGMTCYVDASPIGIIESGNHTSKADFNFIRNLWRPHPITVKIDPVMERLFEITDESVPTEAPTAADIYETSADGSVNTYMKKRSDDKL